MREGWTTGDAGGIADAPPMTHPLVRTQPETGKKSLFMGEHASHLDDRSFEAGRVRLAELEVHATQERFIYRHNWRPGDVLMWDNRCLLHRADTQFRGGEIQARPASHLPARHHTRLKSGGTSPASE